MGELALVSEARMLEPALAESLCDLEPPSVSNHQFPSLEIGKWG